MKVPQVGNTIAITRNGKQYKATIEEIRGVQSVECLVTYINAEGRKLYDIVEVKHMVERKTNNEPSADVAPKIPSVSDLSRELVEGSEHESGLCDC